MRFMLDTNICIYIIRRKPAEALRRLCQTDVRDVCVSAITLSEMEYGVRKSGRPTQNAIALAEFLAPLQTASYDDRAAREYGRLRAFLEGRGTPVGALDMLIAAHALSLDCTLVTHNETEFRRIPRLRVQDWVG